MTTASPPAAESEVGMAASVARGSHIFAQLNMRDIEVGPDILVMEMDNHPHLTNNRGALQGGLVATLIDVVGGRLAWTTVEGRGANVATADMTVHFLSAIVEGPARATATIVRAGKRTVVVAVDVTDVGGGRLAARSTLTFSVLEPRTGASA